MRILILGGTQFLGRHLVEAALARGHELTLFNRGRTNPELFPTVEKIHGDRTIDLAPLNGRSWDAAIDVAGMLPRVVRLSAEALADRVQHYTFVSTRSVYASYSQVGMDESSPLATLPPDHVAYHNPDLATEFTGETYGPLKTLCEQAAEKALPGRVLVTRPGLIVGPYDGSDRFTYWVRRMAEGGEVLAPGRDRAISFIDVRDLAEWTIRLIEANKVGIFNAIGPESLLTMGAFLDTCNSVGGKSAKLTWVTDEFIAAEQVQPWTELPIWLPNDAEYASFHDKNIGRALAAGLTFRPVADTVQDTLAWDKTRQSGPMRAGLDRDKERALLQRWHQANDPHH